MYPLRAHDAPSIPHPFVQVKSPYLCKIPCGGRDATEAVGGPMRAAVDIHECRGFHLQRLPDLFAQIIGERNARGPFYHQAKYLRGHAFVSILGAGLAAELEFTHLPWHIVAVVQPGNSKQTLHILQVHAVGIVEIQAASHVQQVTDCQFLPHGILFLKLGHIFCNGIVDAADIAFIYRNSA